MPVPPFEKYETLLVDMVGVVYDGITPYPEAIRFLNNVTPNQKVVFLSNNPRPSSLTHDNLIKLGLTGDFTVITSGDYTRHVLTQASDHSYFHLGRQRNTVLTQGITVCEVDDLKSASAVILSCFTEEHDDAYQFDAELKEIAQRQLPTYCANPDTYALYGADLRKTAGYFAKRLIEFGLKQENLHILGKPTKAFYEYAAALIPSLNHKDKVLMIGDTIETDIMGAASFGIDSLLTLTGISGRSLIESDQSLAEFLRGYHQDHQPTYIVKQLSLAS